MFQIESELQTVQSEVLFEFLGFPVTNSVLTTLLVSILLISFAIYVRPHLKLTSQPSKLQAFTEILAESILGFVTKIANSRSIAMRIFPVISTLFVFIAVANIFLTVVPILTAFTYEGKSMFRSPTSDISTTVALAAVMIILSHFLSIQKFTFLGHLNKYIRLGALVDGFRQGIGAGLLAIIDVFVGLLDLISEFAKVISLSLRLFGNIFAGELLVVVLMGLFAIALPAPLIGLGLFTGLLQALVFGALVSSYIALSLQEN